MSGRGHCPDVVLDRTDITGFQRPDIYDHVHFARPVKDRATGFIGLDVRQRGPKRETDDRTYRDAATLQKFSGSFDPAGIDADRGKPELSRLVTKLSNIRLAGLRF